MQPNPPSNDETHLNPYAWRRPEFRAGTRKNPDGSYGVSDGTGQEVARVLPGLGNDFDQQRNLRMLSHAGRLHWAVGTAVGDLKSLSQDLKGIVAHGPDDPAALKALVTRIAAEADAAAANHLVPYAGALVIGREAERFDQTHPDDAHPAPPTELPAAEKLHREVDLSMRAAAKGNYRSAAMLLRLRPAGQADTSKVAVSFENDRVIFAGLGAKLAETCLQAGEAPELAQAHRSRDRGLPKLSLLHSPDLLARLETGGLTPVPFGLSELGEIERARVSIEMEMSAANPHPVSLSKIKELEDVYGGSSDPRILLAACATGHPQTVARLSRSQGLGGRKWSFWTEDAQQKDGIIPLATYECYEGGTGDSKWRKALPIYDHPAPTPNLFPAEATGAYLMGVIQKFSEVKCSVAMNDGRYLAGEPEVDQALLSAAILAATNNPPAFKTLTMGGVDFGATHLVAPCLEKLSLAYASEELASSAHNEITNDCIAAVAAHADDSNPQHRAALDEALRISVSRGNPEGVQLLCAAGADPRATPPIPVPTALTRVVAEVKPVPTRQRSAEHDRARNEMLTAMLTVMSPEDRAGVARDVIDNLDLLEGYGAPGLGTFGSCIISPAVTPQLLSAGVDLRPAMSRLVYPADYEKVREHYSPAQPEKAALAPLPSRAEVKRQSQELTAATATLSHEMQ